MPAEKKKMGKIIMLKELTDLAPYQVVSVEVKVVGVEEPTIVGSGLKKPDIVIGDSTGTARLAVWEKEVGRIKKDGSYRLGGLMVREFCKKKFLSTSKQSSMIVSIGLNHPELMTNYPTILVYSGAEWFEEVQWRSTIPNT